MPGTIAPHRSAVKRRPDLNQGKRTVQRRGGIAKASGFDDGPGHRKVAIVKVGSPMRKIALGAPDKPLAMPPGRRFAYVHLRDSIVALGR
jgi:hypothetical protein